MWRLWVQISLSLFVGISAYHPCALLQFLLVISPLPKSKWMLTYIKGPEMTKMLERLNILQTEWHNKYTNLKWTAGIEPCSFWLGSQLAIHYTTPSTVRWLVGLSLQRNDISWMMQWVVKMNHIELEKVFYSLDYNLVCPRARKFYIWNWTKGPFQPHGKSYRFLYVVFMAMLCRATVTCRCRFYSKDFSILW